MEVMRLRHSHVEGGARRLHLGNDFVDSSLAGTTEGALCVHEMTEWLALA